MKQINTLGLRGQPLCQKMSALRGGLGSVRKIASGSGMYAYLLCELKRSALDLSYFALQTTWRSCSAGPLTIPKEGLHRVIRDQVLADAQVLYAA